jgi:hypothetical protein
MMSTINAEMCFPTPAITAHTAGLRFPPLHAQERDESIVEWINAEKKINGRACVGKKSEAFATTKPPAEFAKRNTLLSAKNILA